MEGTPVGAARLGRALSVGDPALFDQQMRGRVFWMAPMGFASIRTCRTAYTKSGRIGTRIFFVCWACQLWLISSPFGLAEQQHHR